MNLQTVTHNNLSFINIANPGELELKHLSMNYGFNTLDLDDYVNKTQIPKVETFKNYSLIVLDFPLFTQNRASSHQKTQEPQKKSFADIITLKKPPIPAVPLPQFTTTKKKRIFNSQSYFFIGKDYLVVLHDDSLSPINDIFTQCQKTLRSRNELMGQGSVFLTYRIIDVLVDSCFPIMNEISSKIEVIDRELEGKNSQSTLEDISITRRNLVYFQTMIKPILPIFRHLEEGKYEELNGEMKPYWSNVLDHLQKIWDRLEDNRELIEGISKSHESLLTSKTNEIVKVLTIFSTILLPLNLIAGLYGMNVQLPFANDPHVFSIIILFMLFTSVFLLTIFSYKRWF